MPIIERFGDRLRERREQRRDSNFSADNSPLQKSGCQLEEFDQNDCKNLRAKLKPDAQRLGASSSVLGADKLSPFEIRSTGLTTKDGLNLELGPSGELLATIQGNNQNRLGTSYVRKDGSFSNDKAWISMSRMQDGLQSKTNSLDHTGTYNIKVQHHGDGKTTLKVSMAPNVETLKIYLGDKEYLLTQRDVEELRKKASSPAPTPSIPAPAPSTGAAPAQAAPSISPALTPSSVSPEAPRPVGLKARERMEPDVVTPDPIIVAPPTPAPSPEPVTPPAKPPNESPEAEESGRTEYVATTLPASPTATSEAIIAPSKAPGPSAVLTPSIKNLAKEVLDALCKPIDTPVDQLKKLTKPELEALNQHFKTLPGSYGKSLVEHAEEHWHTDTRYAERVLMVIKPDPERTARFLGKYIDRGESAEIEWAFQHLNQAERTELLDAFKKTFDKSFKDYILASGNQLVDQYRCLDVIGELNYLEVAKSLRDNPSYANEYLGAISHASRMQVNTAFKDLPGCNRISFLKFTQAKHWSNPEELVPLIRDTPEVKAATNLYRELTAGYFNDVDKIKGIVKNSGASPHKIKQAFEEHYAYRWDKTKLEEVLQHEFLDKQKRDALLELFTKKEEPNPAPIQGVEFALE